MNKKKIKIILVVLSLLLAFSSFNFYSYVAVMQNLQQIKYSETIYAITNIIMILTPLFVIFIRTRFNVYFAYIIIALYIINNILIAI